jgi:hypothetical protein
LKAEVFSTDFIAGLTIFLMAVVIFESFYGNLDSEIGSYKVRNDAQTRANSVADILATSPGYPNNWNFANVETIGLYDSGFLSLDKFNQLMSVEYYTAKREMGVGGYEIYLEVTNSTGSILGNYKYGRPVGENASQVFFVKRLGLANYNGNVTKVILNVGVWS